MQSAGDWRSWDSISTERCYRELRRLGDHKITQDRYLENEIVLAPVRPLHTPEQAAKAWNLFLELKQKLLTSDDYQNISGKKFIKKSGFRKIAVAFNLSDTILESKRIDSEDGSFTWRIVVEVQAPNRRICTGVAVCDSKERKFAHVEHDVFATCHTRAKNRAISDMVAGGVVSAEEVEVSSSETTAVEAEPGTRISVLAITPVLDRDGIVDTLEGSGLDTEDLDISVTDGKAVVRPTKYLGDIWDRYNSVLWKLGMKWISAGKESRWESGE